MMRWMAVVAAALASCSSNTNLDGVMVDALPRCLNQRNCGWWAYNQSKIVRRGDRVVTYTVDNDFPDGTPYKLNLIQKIGDAPWIAGASLPTSRPANLLVDASGAIHALVFEPFDDAVNDSVGALRHYTFAGDNDLTHFTEETAIDNDGSTETVNIRAGAAIGADGTLYAGFGLGQPSPELQSELLYEKRPGAAWTKSTAGTQLGHDFYYAYVLPLASGGVSLLPIQDDQVPGQSGNAYQMVRYFERAASGAWSQNPLIDLSSNPIAQTRLAMLQQSDFYQAQDGSVHVLSAEYLDPEHGYFTTTMRHDVLQDGAWTTGSIDMPDGSCNWMRLFEAGGRMFTLCQTYDTTFIRALGGAKSARIDLPGELTGGYPYLAAPRGGTSPSEAYLDVLLVSGDASAYPNGPAYYLRIPKASLSKL